MSTRLWDDWPSSSKNGTLQLVAVVSLFLSLPPTWPLVRLMIPIKHMVKQMETLPGLLLRDNLNLPSASTTEFLRTQDGQRSWSSPSAQLAETVTERLQSVLCHPSKGLVDEGNASLLTHKFWVQAIYTELLHASCRYRAVREQEQERPPRRSCVFPMIERP